MHNFQDSNGSGSVSKTRMRKVNAVMFGTCILLGVGIVLSNNIELQRSATVYNEPSLSSMLSNRDVLNITPETLDIYMSRMADQVQRTPR